MRNFTSMLYNEEGYEQRSGCWRTVSHFSGLCIENYKEMQVENETSREGEGVQVVK